MPTDSPKSASSPISTGSITPTTPTALTSPATPASHVNPPKSARPAQRNPFRSFVSTAPPGEELTNARRLPLALIDINPHQARQQFDEEALEELAASIREHDVLQPIGVVHKQDRYQIIFGERRFRAAMAAEKADIPAVIYEHLDEEEAAILTALENLQREDLDLEDEARQFSYLLEVTRLSQRALAERLGKTHNYISRRVRLLRDRPELFATIREGRLTQKEALGLLASDGEVYHGDTEAARANGVAGAEGAEGQESEAADATVDRQIGVYHGDTLVSVISMGDTGEIATARTPRDELPVPRAGIPTRWQAITRTYRVLGKIQPEAVPIEECEGLAHQLEELETLVATTRRALQARLESEPGSKEAEKASEDLT